MKKFVCIHGHFYQPPRENPWIEAIELQDSAYPYPDWNERVTAECYAPNAFSRILDPHEYICDIVNNYAKISFNFGPTLLTWMEKNQPDVYAKILDADRTGQKHFSGHGGAIAQAYNHMILPLANERDKRTQVIWGIRDFEFRFKRFPEGMWLPETAVDLPTLEILAEQGIKFTVLAPAQAQKVRKIGEEAWQDLGGPAIDPQRPYLCRLPSGKAIALFFYDGPISHGVAFEGLLNNGEGFAHRLASSFPAKHQDSRLVHIATDGETYGHHHRFGNMALSYCLGHIEENEAVRLTVYGEFLEKHPPGYEVQINENSSWSCMHGVERWRADCGCHVGGSAEWNQAWRKPLRETLDWLRDKLIPIFEQEMGAFCQDVWTVRDRYIQVILDRSRENVERFLREEAGRDLNKDEQVRMMKLLEMQRQAMLMYTSCGWFFDDVSGIETAQIIQYAARAIQLLNELTGTTLEAEFMDRLAAAQSNTNEGLNGAKIYEEHIKPLMIDLRSVGVHYAIASLFEEACKSAPIYCYDMKLERCQRYEVGKQILEIGKAHITSMITLEECRVDFSVIHLGDYNLNGGVRYHADEESFESMHESIKRPFFQNNIPEVIHQMDAHFGMHNYSLWDLFKNEQGKVLNIVFENTLNSIETHLRGIYHHYYPLMQLRPDFRIPLPKALAMTVEFILNRDIVDILEKESINLSHLEQTVHEIKRWNFTRDKETLGYVTRERVTALMESFAGHLEDVPTLKTLSDILRIMQPLALQLDLGKAQNLYFDISRKHYDQKWQAAKNDDLAREWVDHFDILGRYLKVKAR